MENTLNVTALTVLPAGSAVLNIRSARLTLADAIRGFALPKLLEGSEESTYVSPLGGSTMVPEVDVGVGGWVEKLVGVGEGVEDEVDVGGAPRVAVAVADAGVLVGVPVGGNVALMVGVGVLASVTTSCGGCEPSREENTAPSVLSGNRAKV